MQRRGSIRCLNVSRNALFYRTLLLLVAFVACILPAFFPACAQPLPFSKTSPTPAASRVLVVEDGSATVAFEPRPDAVRNMVNRGMVNFTRQTNAASAWRTLVATQDIVGIKVFSAPGAQVGTRA